MRFRVTSVACSETGALLRDATVQLEDALNSALRHADFGDGVDQFSMVIISVDDDILENHNFAKPHNKLGSFKNPFTNEKVRLLSLAVPIPPSVILAKEPEPLLALVSKSTLAQLQTRPKRLPKGFDYEHLCSSVTNILRGYVEKV